MIRLRRASLGNASLGLIVCWALLSCGSSPPTRYYSLSEVSPDNAGGNGGGNGGGNASGAGVSSAGAISTTTTSSSAGSVPVRLEPVAIPAELDRPELVNHSGTNDVHIADQDRWVAPLDEQIRRSLSDDLASRLPAGQVADPNEPITPDPRRTLSISIGQFSADAGCAVTLRVTWVLQTPHARDQSGSQRVDQPSAGTCPAALPAAMSRALATLADRLAPVLAR